MKIENVKQLPPGGNVIATFDAYFEELQLTIHKIKLIRTKKGALIISTPSYSVEQEFEKKWHPYFEFSEQKQKEFYAESYKQLKNFGI